jgi:succinate dehydrogenase / fumarate reductase flavoprotein subunit
MRGGKFLNNWRMAELHAKEAPDRVWELEAWGAVFDRTKDGKISQRNFGGHEYPRLAHVGDRTGLEMIRSLQQKVVAMQQADAVEFGDPEAMIRVFAETTITELIKDDEGRIAGAFGYFRDTGRFVVFEAPAVVLATGGIGKTYKVTSNSWEYTGDGHALALRAGAKLLNMEFVQLHPTGMVWPPSVRGLLVTESVRGDGGVLRNSEGKRFMFNYVPDVFRTQYAETEDEADRWYDDPDHNRRPPELLPRDEVARSINSEVKAGRGSPHGGVFLDIASRRPAQYILQRLPSMYHQFKELADVDITKEPMEIGPTAHYVMGGTPGPRRCPACSRWARCPVACTGPTGWAATPCPTCWSSAAGPGWARPGTCRRWRPGRLFLTPPWTRTPWWRRSRWSGPRARARTPSTASCRRS